jgi:FO synthase
MSAIGPARGSLTAILDRAANGAELSEADIVALFAARGESFREVCAAADALRVKTCTSRVSYVVTRNINYTNVCLYRCAFCAFSKGKTHESLRGRPYDLSLDEITRRCREAWERGAVEPACRAASIRTTPARPTLRSARPSRRQCPTCTSTPSRRSKSRKARQHWG